MADCGAMRRPAAFALLVVGLLLGAAPPVRAQETFGVRGQITDTGDAVLPGVRVTLTDGLRDHVAITDLQGRYAIGDLLPGAYRLDTMFPGFRDGSRQVALGTTPWADVDLRLRIAPLEIADRIHFTPQEAVRQASAIAHVRTGATRTPALCSDDGDFNVAQEMTVLSVVKGDLTPVIEILRYTLDCMERRPVPPVARPLPAAGSEFVLFLQRHDDGRYASSAPETSFSVRNGSVNTHGFNDLPAEMELSAFIAALNRLWP